MPLLLVLAACVPDPADQARAEDSAVVFMYHRFGETAYPSTSIRVTQFEAHLDHLENGGYTIVSLAEILSSLRDGASLPERAVAITIDDAYRSVYEIAYPLLEARGYPFTVFVATDPVDQGLPDYMTWEQMRAMQEGGASFANHGASHASLIERRTDETEAQRLARVRADVERSAKRLSEELSPLEGVFAWPYGEFDSATADQLASMDYVSFGQHSGAIGPTSDLRALPRYAMNEAYAEIGEFRTKAASLPLPVLNIDPWSPVTSDTRPRIEVTLGESTARLDELACFIGGQGQVGVDWLVPGRRFAVGPEREFPAGRHRVNCTAPGSDGRYQWFGYLWIIGGSSG